MKIRPLLGRRICIGRWLHVNQPYRLIHMQPSTDTNTTTDQWSLLYKNIIFLVIILILKHVLFRLKQKYLSPVINCLLCCMNWYSWGVICKSHRIRTRSHRIRMVVKFYNHMLRATVQMHSDAILSSTGTLLLKTVIQNNRQ